MASYPRKYLLTSTSLSTTTSDVNTEACYMCFVCPDYCSKSILSPSPQFSPPQKYKMSPIFIIMLCILGATFLLFSYVIARCRYSISRNSTERNSPQLGDNNFMHGNDQGSSLVSRHPSWFIQITGHPRLTIESIGEVRYKREEALRDCCICLSEFEEEERLRVLTKCGHAFHVDCIDTWLMSHMNCPVCRSPIILSVDDVSSSNSQQEFSELLQVENMVNEEDIIDHDFADKMGIRRSVSVDVLHGSSIQTQQMKRSSSFTGN